MSGESDGRRIGAANAFDNSRSAATSQNTSAANSYSNKASSTALKASGALARLGKAIYGSSSASNGGSRESPEFYINSPAHSSPIDRPTVSRYGSQGIPEISYMAKSAILAMSQNADRSLVAIAGHDFFKVLHPGREVSVKTDLRGEKKARQFDKLYTVTSLKWSSGVYSNNIALATSGGDIFLYDADRAQPQIQMKELNRAVPTLEFSAKVPNQLLSGSNDGVVRLWDIRLGKKPVMSFLKNGDATKEIKFRPWDAKKFAVIYNSGVVQRWDLRNPQVADRKLSAHTGAGSSLDWHSDLDYVVTGGRDQLIQVWNMSSEGRNPDYIIQTPNPVSKVRWQTSDQPSRNILNSSIASCGGRQDYNVRVWDLKRPHIPLYVLENHTDSVSEIEFVTDKVMRTTSKDSLFIQHDLEFEPYVVNNLSSQAIEWRSLNELTFASQNKYRLHSMPMKRSSSAAPIDEHATSANTSGNNDHVSGLRRNRIATPAHFGSNEPTSQERTGGIASRRSNGALPHMEVDYHYYVCDVALPRDDTKSFSYLADNYRTAIEEGQTFSDVCLINASAAIKALKFRTAKTWEIIGKAVLHEENEFLASLPANISFPAIATAQHARNNEAMNHRLATESSSQGHLSAKLSKTKMELKPRIPESETEDSRPLDEAASGSTTANSARISPISTKPQLANHDNLSIGAFEAGGSWSQSLPNMSMMATAGVIDIPNSHATHSAAPISISQSIKRTGVSFMSQADGQSFLSSKNLTASSPEESYGGLRGGESGESFTRLAMRGSSFSGTARSVRHLSFSSSNSAEMDDKELFPKHVQRLQKVPEESSVATRNRSNISAIFGGLGSNALDDDSSKHMSEDSLGESSLPPRAIGMQSSLYKASSSSADIADSNSKSGDGLPMGVVDNVLQDESEADSDTEARLFREYLAKLDHPWRAENLIQKSVEWAMSQGDCQFLVVSSMLLQNLYPKAFPSTKAIEECTIMYLDLLRRSCQFLASAEIVKSTQFDEIKETGLTSTQFDPLCHRCLAPLADNAKSEYLQEGEVAGYWYCMSCRTILDGCMLCNSPIKGISVAFFDCGHKGHIACLKEWVKEGETECPSGCGATIVPQSKSSA